METSALDSTNVEAAFNEVLTGNCEPSILSSPELLFYRPLMSLCSLQLFTRRWPAGRWPGAPSAPSPCPAPSAPAASLRIRAEAAARAPSRLLLGCQTPLCPPDPASRWDSRSGFTFCLRSGLCPPHSSSQRTSPFKWKLYSIWSKNKRLRDEKLKENLFSTLSCLWWLLGAF